MKFPKATPYAAMTVILATVVILSVLDLYLDGHAFVSTVHFWVEIGIVILFAALTIFMFGLWRSASRQALDAEQQLQEYLQGLGRQIEHCFRKWGLTETEQRTAVLILKGYSLRDIAARCHRSEGTVRQHAVAIYRKAGLTSRAEFSAYFLQEIVKLNAAKIRGPQTASDLESTVPFAVGSDQKWLAKGNEIGT